jgi:hypothetical protein
LEGVNCGPRGSVREYAILKAAKRKEDLEHFRFLCLIKTLMVDKTERSQVLQLNNLFSKYFDVFEPMRAKERAKFTKANENIIASFNQFFTGEKEKHKKKNKKKNKNKKTETSLLRSFEKI